MNCFASAESGWKEAEVEGARDSYLQREAAEKGRGIPEHSKGSQARGKPCQVNYV